MIRGTYSWGCNSGAECVCVCVCVCKKNSSKIHIKIHMGLKKNSSKIHLKFILKLLMLGRISMPLGLPSSVSPPISFAYLHLDNS